jgi:general stress protein 26
MRVQDPKRVRPKFPKEWNVPQRPAKWITWTHARARLEQEKIYWISTVRSNGTPHSVPLWGIWRDNKLFFETNLSSVKARNIALNPKIVFHIQDGNDTVIGEGSARREDQPRLLQELRSEYEAKYNYKPNWRKGGPDVVFKVEPEIIHAWKNPHMHQSMVKFVF